MSFNYRELECKSRKSRNTWSNRHIWPWNTEWRRGKANRVLPRECTGHSKHPLPTTQEKTLHMDITRWSMLKADWLYSLQPKMEKLYTISKNKTGRGLWLRSWTPYCQIRLKLKQVGKTTRPFRYDLNQVPYVFTCNYFFLPCIHNMKILEMDSQNTVRKELLSSVQIPRILWTATL